MGWSNPSGKAPPGGADPAPEWANRVFAAVLAFAAIGAALMIIIFGSLVVANGFDSDPCESGQNDCPHGSGDRGLAIAWALPCSAVAGFLLLAGISAGCRALGRPLSWDEPGVLGKRLVVSWPSPAPSS